MSNNSLASVQPQPEPRSQLVDNETESDGEPVFEYKDLCEKDKLLSTELQLFFHSRPGALELLLGILKSDPLSEMSRRLINQFIVRYTVNRGIHYLIPLPMKAAQTDPRQEPYILFTLNASYKRQLKDWKKLDFDPFRRRQRIQWALESGRIIVTTLCQLNFFRWLLEYNVVQYVFRHRKVIERAINDETAQTNNTLLKRKREPEGDANMPRGKKQKASSIPRMACIPVPSTVVTWAFHDDETSTEPLPVSS